VVIKNKSITVILAVFLYWLIVFAPFWLGHSFIKTQELIRVVGKSREQSLVVMHPAQQMQGILNMKNYLLSQKDYPLDDIAILAPDRSSSLPLVTDPSILRAINYPVPVIRDRLKLMPYSLVVVTQSFTRQNSNSFQAKFCSDGEIMGKNCFCLEDLSWQPASNQEVLCWLLP